MIDRLLFSLKSFLIDEFDFPFFLVLGDKANWYPMELVEVGTSWRGHHGYPKIDEFDFCWIWFRFICLHLLIVELQEESRSLTTEKTIFHIEILPKNV